MIKLTMSAPSEFILLWNSMQPTPSPKSMSEAPEFFFTTPFDFLATVVDHTPAGTCTGSQVPVLSSQYLRPDEDFVSSPHQDFCPALSTFSTFAALCLPSFSLRGSLSLQPRAYYNRNGPDS